MMLETLKVGPIRPTFQMVPIASLAPAPAESHTGKLLAGGAIAILTVGAIALIATRHKSALPNYYARNAKTSAKKRAYMKGYRAGRKFCR